jgi:hypothetical protein
VPQQQVSVVDGLVNEAIRRAEAQDFGPGAWWKIVFTIDYAALAFGIHFHRILGVRHRLTGNRRLQDFGVIMFHSPEAPEEQQLFTPTTEATVVFRMPSPGHGAFGRPLAQDWATTIRSMISFAGDAPARDMGAGFWPLAEDDEDVVRAKTLLEDQSLGELAAGGIGLLSNTLALTAGTPENTEALQRVRGALLAYEQGLLQESEYVVMVMFVSAIEALFVPNQPWQEGRLSKRFIESTLVLCLDAVDEVRTHGNFREAFGKRSNRKQLLSPLYSLRSTPLHTGMLGHPVGMFVFSMNMGGGARVPLTSDLARASILAFLQRPFSPLWGHPVIDKQLNPDPPEAPGS